MHRTSFSELKDDGGACKNSFLLQFQADIVGCPVDRSRLIESTGMGATYLAGIATGLWKAGDQIGGLRQSDMVFVPMIDGATRNRLYTGWKYAVSRIKSTNVCYANG